MYKLLRDKISGITRTVIRLEDNACIPCSEDNTDYQAYLRWLEEGNTPIPADEVTE